MMAYVATSKNKHGADEERQWARVVAHDDAARGVALIFIQKLCTAFHEFEPAWHSGALNLMALEYFQARLAGRARRVLEVLDANGLADIEGVPQLRDLVSAIEVSTNMDVLAALAEPVHGISHILTDALER